jgi:hypothetical protein
MALFATQPVEFCTERFLAPPRTFEGGETSQGQAQCHYDAERMAIGDRGKGPPSTGTTLGSIGLDCRSGRGTPINQTRFRRTFLTSHHCVFASAHSSATLNTLPWIVIPASL